MGLKWSELYLQSLEWLNGYVVGLRRICIGSKLDAIGLMMVFNGLG